MITNKINENVPYTMQTFNHLIVFISKTVLSIEPSIKILKEKMTTKSQLVFYACPRMKNINSHFLRESDNKCISGVKEFTQ